MSDQAAEEKARNRAALKAAQVALQGVGDEDVAAAFSAVEKVIADFRGTASKPEPQPEPPHRAEKRGHDRMEHGGKNRSE